MFATLAPAARHTRHPVRHPRLFPLPLTDTLRGALHLRGLRHTATCSSGRPSGSPDTDAGRVGIAERGGRRARAHARRTRVEVRARARGRLTTTRAEHEDDGFIRARERARPPARPRTLVHVLLLRARARYVDVCPRAWAARQACGRSRPLPPLTSPGTRLCFFFASALLASLSSAVKSVSVVFLCASTRLRPCSALNSFFDISAPAATDASSGYLAHVDRQLLVRREPADAVRRGRSSRPSAPCSGRARRASRTGRRPARPRGCRACGS